MAAWIGGLGAVVIAAVPVVGRVFGIDGGLLGILQILWQDLALACLILVPLAVVARSRFLWVALAAVLVVFAATLGDEWLSLPAPAGSSGIALAVVTWNMQAQVRGGPDAIEMLRAHPADLVALQELTPAVSEAIDGDPVLRARYPYRALRPQFGVLGVGLLSTQPLTNDAYDVPPTSLQATLEIPDGRTITVITAHPLPGDIRFLRGLTIPIGIGSTERNAEVRSLRARVQALEDQGQTVLLLGDFNTAPTEPVFTDLTAGLHDAHREVGFGPGWTWRPETLEFLNTGLLRIDLVLSTSALVPRSDSIACPPFGDHCLMHVQLELTSASP